MTIYLKSVRYVRWTDVFAECELAEQLVFFSGGYGGASVRFAFVTASQLLSDLSIAGQPPAVCRSVRTVETRLKTLPSNTYVLQ